MVTLVKSSTSLHKARLEPFTAFIPIYNIFQTWPKPMCFVWEIEEVWFRG